MKKKFALYDAVSRLAPKIIADERQIYKGVSPNVDFYSGFAYSMLGLPVELYTPIFAIARIAGWSAHRLEEVAINGKIMRPAYKNIGEHKEYIPMEKTLTRRSAFFIRYRSILSSNQNVEPHPGSLTTPYPA